MAPVVFIEDRRPVQVLLACRVSTERAVVILRGVL